MIRGKNLSLKMVAIPTSTTKVNHFLKSIRDSVKFKTQMAKTKQIQGGF